MPFDYNLKTYLHAYVKKLAGQMMPRGRCSDQLAEEPESSLAPGWPQANPYAINGRHATAASVEMQRKITTVG
jgi:hypothetical protein